MKARAGEYSLQEWRRRQRPSLVNKQHGVHSFDSFVRRNGPPPHIEGPRWWPSRWAILRSPNVFVHLHCVHIDGQAAIATFDLPCSGHHGILDVGYFLSYDGMGAVKVKIEATPEELARRRQEPNFGLHHPLATQRGAAAHGGLDIPNDPSQGKERGRDEEDSDMSFVTIVDSLWGTRASVMGYQAMSIPRGIRGGDIRVTFEILSAAKEMEYDVGLDDNGERLDRGDRKFKLVNMQCC